MRRVVPGRRERRYTSDSRARLIRGPHGRPHGAPMCYRGGPPGRKVQMMTVGPTARAAAPDDELEQNDGWARAAQDACGARQCPQPRGGRTCADHLCASGRSPGNPRAHTHTTTAPRAGHGALTEMAADAMFGARPGGRGHTSGPAERGRPVHSEWWCVRNSTNRRLSARGALL